MKLTKLLNTQLFLLVFSTFTASNIFANTQCLDKYKSSLKYSQLKSISLISSHEEIVTLSSSRKMNYRFQKGTNFENEKKIKVVFHGLGKSIEDLEPLFTEAKKRGESILAFDLHGFGKTAKNNTSYDYFHTIPIEFSVTDCLEILRAIDPAIKLDLIGHSYGWGVVFEILKQTKKNNITLNIDTVVNNNGLDKNLDKFYMDSIFTGEYLDVMINSLNPNLALMGVPDHVIQLRNNLIQVFANPIRNPIRWGRDQMFSFFGPYLEEWRNTFTAAPNYLVNILLSQPHIVANSSMEGLQKMISHPDELTKIVLYNIAVMFGSRDVNSIDFSKNLEVPKNYKYIFVSATNDSVVPSPIMHNVFEKFRLGGYNIKQFILSDENHYSIYSPNVAETYDVLMGNR